MKHFAVIGNPIAHSKSPAIHHAFAKQFDLKLDYQRLLAEPQDFPTTAAHFFQHGAGANVTVPFKEAALRFADTLSEAASLAGAVNTLTKRDGEIHGDNTDGIGLVRDIRDNHGWDWQQKTILIIGAGGAARGVIAPILAENPKHITIVNRTASKAQALAEQFNDNKIGATVGNTVVGKVTALSVDSLSSPFDMVINATSASLAGAALRLDTRCFCSQTLAYDMMYAAQPTPFMQLATQASATAVDGLGMLVEQAAQSFKLWHGVMPSTPSVIKSLRAEL